MSTKFLICLMVLFSACTSFTDKRLKYALDLAGENRQELEKVLEHYQNDPKRLMAARFLIENMPRWYGYEGRLLDSIRPVLIAGAKNRYIPKETISKWQGKPFYSSAKVYDAKTITATYLIGNIDQAFEVYQKYPWNRNLPFDDFCELILPYRIGDEPITGWRQMYRDRYMPLLDSLYPGGTDVVEACRILADELKKEPEYYNTDFSLPRLGGEFLLDNRIGYCRESCDVTLYAMRACGIPVAIDFFEYSPEYQQAHMWTVLRDTTGKCLPFWYTQFEPRRDMKDDGRKKGKIYRNCFGLQPEPIPGITANEAAPGLFRNRFVKDVTANYSGENQITIPIWKKDAEAYVYLGVFSPGEWVPVDIAKREKQQATFHNVEPDIIYLPIFYNNESSRPAGYPFLTTPQGYRQLIPDTTRWESVRLLRKMPLMPNYRNVLKDLIGGRIEGANRADFADAVLLHEITDTLKSNYITVTPELPGRYRYVRYVAPPTYKLELAELTLFADTGCMQKIPLKPMSGKQPTYNPEDLIDDNILTGINVRDVACAIGFEVTEKAKIEKIVFSPRNDDNFVWAGQEYELFYFAGTAGWKSLGRQTATERELHYQVPANALLWLRNLTKGREEQVFIAENGEQLFIHNINR